MSEENKIITESTDKVGRPLIPSVGKTVEIGIDTSNSLVKNLVDAADSSTLDLSALQNFSNISQSREQVYELIDVMSQDSDIASVIESYVDEICEPNDNGDIIWVESSDPDVLKFCTFIMDCLNANKHIRGWANSVVKYGDLYFKLFSEEQDDAELDSSSIPQFSGNTELDRRKTKALNEAVNNVRAAYDKVANLDEEVIELKDDSDKAKLVEDVVVAGRNPNTYLDFYVEAERNPAEMFELTKRGKTAGFIKAPTNVLNLNNTQTSASNFYYKFNTKQKDVTLYDPMRYVHAYLEDNSSRVPEEVSVSTEDDKDGYTYSVRRGQSLLYNSYKVWRELKLLETSVLLNRLTKSSVIRILEVEVGNLPDTQIRGILANIKSMIEQKSAINVGISMSEYTMPGPVENTIYLPTRGEIGKIQVQELGMGDVDPKSLLDLDYFNNKLYGSLRVPKAFFNFTDDGAGFNGGESLAILSGRFGKAVKRIQSVLCQAVTDVINIFLLDRGLSGYINKFTIKMQAPLTKEALDRKQADADEVNLIRDLIGVIRDDVEDPEIRLEMLKVLLKNVPQSADLTLLIQKMIDKLEANPAPANTNTTPNETATSGGSSGKGLKPLGAEAEGTEDTVDELEAAEEPTEEPAETGSEEGGEDYLPSFDELGIEDATDLSNNA